MDECEAVLGTQWFRTLGPIWWDFARLEMRFHWRNREVELRGIKLPTPKMIEEREMEREVKRRRCGWVCHVQLMRGEQVEDNLKAIQSNRQRVGGEHVKAYLNKIEFGADSVGPNHCHQQIKVLLESFADIFREPQGLPPLREHEHLIRLQPNAGPVNVRPYRYPHYQKNEIEKIVLDLLKSGVVKSSTSPYSSPVLLVKKHDGSWRLCVDYRALNQVTIKDKFPIPVIDELLDELHGAQVFSKLDLRSGYHQIRMAEGDIEKTAFRTHHGHYEFLVMPFGLTNAPSTFQALMNDIFSKLLRKYVLVFFDDILIYSKTWEEHITHLQEVLTIIRSHQLFLRQKKCEFGRDSISYLGHVISSQGVAMDPEKTSAMIQWPKPTSVKALRGFLGLTGYYRKFIQGYGDIAGPLTQLLKKGAFEWSEVADLAFNKFKRAMTTGPVLALPDFNKSFVVECDASGTGIGAILMQDLKPIAYFSQAIKGKNLAKSTYEKEMMALIAAVQKWRPYLLGQKFVVRTDQKSLRHLFEQTITTEAQQKWLVKLMGYDFTIEYKKGRENTAADSLSRREDQDQLSAISTPIPHWIEPIQEEILQEKELQDLVLKIQQGEALGPWSYKSGLIFFKGRIYLRPQSTLTKEIIHELHSGSHEGFHKMWHRLKSVFYWRGACAQIKEYLRGCDICQRNKSELTLPAGLLQPLPIPTMIWRDISMDFVDGLPNSQGKTVIFVVVDRLSKYAHFIPLKHPYSAIMVAEEFFENIFKLHGLPTSIVCDRDPTFTSNFWRELFRLQGTRFNFSSAYHPQTDGQTEVVNRTLEMYLRCFTGDRPKEWVKWLSWVEYIYNTSYHSSTGMSPFELVYGRPAPSLLSYIPGTARVEAVGQQLEARDVLLQQARFKLSQAQNRMKKVYDKGHKEREFQMGDLVYVKLHPYRQHTVSRRLNMKLAAKFYGPYKIVGKMGKVAYQLELPQGSKVHPVFHVSLLRKQWGSTNPASSTALPEVSQDIPELIPQAILDFKGQDNKREVLVHWRGHSPADATWENVQIMQQQFPEFDLGDKVAS